MKISSTLLSNKVLFKFFGEKISVNTVHQFDQQLIEQSVRRCCRRETESPDSERETWSSGTDIPRAKRGRDRHRQCVKRDHPTYRGTRQNPSIFNPILVS